MPVKFRIYLGKQYKGTVEIADEITTDPKAQARRDGLLEKSEIPMSLAYKVDDDEPEPE